MSSPAPILIPFDAVDNTAAAFDTLIAGFDNLSMQAAAADLAFASMADTADAAGGALGRFGTALDMLAGQTDGAAVAAEKFNAAMQAFDPQAQVAGIDAMAGAYSRLAAEMRAAAMAGQGVHPAGAMAGPGGAFPPGATPPGAPTAPHAALSPAQQVAAASLAAQGIGGMPGGTTPPGTPPPDPAADHGGDHGGGGGEGGYGPAQMLKQMLVYSGAYTFYAAIKNSMSRNQATDYAAAGEATQLGMSNAEMQRVQDRNAALQLSGGTVYDQQQLNEAIYTPATFGAQLGSLDTQQSLTMQGVQLAQVTGSPNPGIAESALTYAQLAYGGKTTPRQTADLLMQENVQSGYHLDQIGANAGTFLPGAAQRGISLSDALAGYGNESAQIPTPGEGAQDFAAFEREIGGNANNTERHYASEFQIDLGDPTLVADSGGYEALLKKIAFKTGVAGPEKQQQALTDMFGAEGGRAVFSQIAGGWASFDANRAAGDVKDQSGKKVGAFGAAWETNQANSAVQLAESENKLKGQFDHLTKDLVPLEKPLIDKFAGLIEAIGLFTESFTKPGGLGQYVNNATSTLKRYMDPSDPGFGNFDKAREEAGTPAALDASAAAALKQKLDPTTTNGGGIWNPFGVGRTSFSDLVHGAGSDLSAAGSALDGMDPQAMPAATQRSTQASFAARMQHEDPATRRAALKAGADALQGGASDPYAAELAVLDKHDGLSPAHPLTDGYHVPTPVDYFSAQAMGQHLSDPLPAAPPAAPPPTDPTYAQGTGMMSGAISTMETDQAVADMAHYEDTRGAKGGATAEIRVAKEGVINAIKEGTPDDQIWVLMGMVHDAIFAQPGGQTAHGADYGKFRLQVVAAMASRHKKATRGILHDAHGQLRDMQSQFSMDLKAEGASGDFSGAQQEYGAILQFEGTDQAQLGMDGYAISTGAESMQARLGAAEHGYQGRQDAAAARARTVAARDHRERLVGEHRTQKDLRDTMEIDKLHHDTTAYRRDVAALSAYEGQHLADFGMDSKDLALQTAQLLGTSAATVQTAPGDRLIRPAQVDNGSALAGYEQGSAQLSRIQTNSPLAEQLAELRRQNEHLNHVVAEQKATIDSLEHGHRLTKELIGAVYETAGHGPSGTPPPRHPRRGGT